MQDEIWHRFGIQNYNGNVYSVVYPIIFSKLHRDLFIDVVKLYFQDLVYIKFVSASFLPQYGGFLDESIIFFMCWSAAEFCLKIYLIFGGSARVFFKISLSFVFKTYFEKGMTNWNVF